MGRNIFIAVSLTAVGYGRSSCVSYFCGQQLRSAAFEESDSGAGVTDTDILRGDLMWF